MFAQNDDDDFGTLPWKQRHWYGEKARNLIRTAVAALRSSFEQAGYTCKMYPPYSNSWSPDSGDSDDDRRDETDFVFTLDHKQPVEKDTGDDDMRGNDWNGWGQGGW